MDKLEFLPAASNAEHLDRHSDSTSQTIGSKAINTTTKDDIANILSKFDKAYENAIEEKGNPGRMVFAVKTDRWVGTDAVVSADELQKDKIFNIVREPGTRGETQINVAIVNAKDMPKTNVVHAIYGPYGPTGKGGIYTMMFGDPGEPFPKELPENADERTIALNQKAKDYWLGKDGKGGHVFLVTPEELTAAIKQMEECGLDTRKAAAKLAEFQNNPVSPIISHTPSEMAKDAKDLGKVYLKPSMQMLRFKGREM